MIILGPPPRVARTNTPPFRNVEEFTRICLPMCSLYPFRAEERPRSYPSAHAHNFFLRFTPLPSVLVTCMCVFVCVCLLLPRVLRFRSPRSLVDESSIAR